jgi:hypothetical protein
LPKSNESRARLAAAANEQLRIESTIGIAMLIDVVACRNHTVHPAIGSN